MEPVKTGNRNGPKDGRKVFLKSGTCSRTFFHILNREFGHLKPIEERASDTLAGGIMQEGHQCGMLWGASLAVGAEAHRRFENPDQAIAVAILATQKIMESFKNREGTINCREITHCDFSNKLSMAKYFVSGRFLHCYNLAQHWAPEAVNTALKGLSDDSTYPSEPCLSCATEVAKKIGASEEESIMVAGFAGGLGLSGGGCGALAAVIWLKSLEWCNDVPKKMAMNNPHAQETLSAFYQLTHSELLCSKITGRKFETISAHTRYIQNAGCAQLIQNLAHIK
ncbi:MAG: C-GCAxxG-C-C family protein [Allomuricauda sp.]